MGYLGEYKFRQYLISEDIMCVWNEFIKPDYTLPDFNVRDKSIDVKTTYDDALWVQKAEWDFYVLGIMNNTNTEISFVGWIGKRDLEKLLKSKKYLVEREGRQDYRIPLSKLRIMRELKLELEGVM